MIKNYLGFKAGIIMTLKLGVNEAEVSALLVAKELLQWVQNGRQVLR